MELTIFKNFFEGAKEKKITLDMFYWFFCGGK